MADNDEKIVKALEALQADVTTIKTEHGKRFDGIEKTLNHLMANVGTVLIEQQHQRTDMRYFHDDLNRIEEKIDKVVNDVKNDKERIENLEVHTGASNPHKN